MTNSTEAQTSANPADQSKGPTTYSPIPAKDKDAVTSVPTPTTPAKGNDEVMSTPAKTS